MKVLHIAPYFAPAYCYGGPPRSILALCKSLQQHCSEKLEVSVLTTTANGDEELLVPVAEQTFFEGVSVCYLPRTLIPSLFLAKGQKKAMLNAIEQADVVHIHGCWNVFVWQAASVCRMLKKPYIITVRGMLTPDALNVSRRKKKLLYPFQKKDFLHSSGLHVTSEYERNCVESFGFDKPVFMVPNPVDFSYQGKDSSRSDARLLYAINDELVLLSVGRIHPIKGIEVMCDAIRLLADEGQQGMCLLLAGDGEKSYVKHLQDKYRSLINNGMLRFLGSIYDEEKQRLYQAADVYISTSHSENFGMSIAEGLLSGLPVILSKYCPWPQIELWQAGLMVENCPDVVSSAIRFMYENSDKRKLFGINAAKNSRAFLDVGSIANQMYACYQKALA